MSDERMFKVLDVDEQAAASMLQQEGQFETTADDIGRAVPVFHEVKCRGFLARHAFIAGDIVVHFFMNVAVEEVQRADPRTQQQWETYWLESFPEVLSRVAKEYFQADRPRLEAKYTDLVASWWFRARGYADGMDPEGLVTLFYRRLEEALNHPGPS